MLSSTTKTCKKHGEQALDKWYAYKRKNSSATINYQCKLCAAFKSKIAQKKKAKWYAEYKRKWWKKNKKKSHLYYKKDRENKLAQRREAYHKIRLEVLKYYCGRKDPFCACCGETAYQFLALDHKFGNGSIHRKKLRIKGGSGRMAEWAKNNKYPPIFRVLCHNCNTAYGHYGTCPHQDFKKSIT